MIVYLDPSTSKKTTSHKLIKTVLLKVNKNLTQDFCSIFT